MQVPFFLHECDRCSGLWLRMFTCAIVRRERPASQWMSSFKHLPERTHLIAPLPACLSPYSVSRLCGDAPMMMPGNHARNRRALLVSGNSKQLQESLCPLRSPWENGYCESFNSRVRDELRNGELFYSLREAQILIEQWRVHYNSVGPHSALDYRPSDGSKAHDALPTKLHHPMGGRQLDIYVSEIAKLKRLVSNKSILALDDETSAQIEAPSQLGGFQGLNQRVAQEDRIPKIRVNPHIWPFQGFRTDRNIVVIHHKLGLPGVWRRLEWHCRSRRLVRNKMLLPHTEVQAKIRALYRCFTVKLKQLGWVKATPPSRTAA